MNLFFGSESFGTRSAAVTLIAIAGLATTASFAQQPETDTLFGDAVINLLLEARTQKPAAQANSQERAAAVEELTNMYLVTNLPSAIEMGNEPSLRAQIELQERALIYNAFANDFFANNQATEQEIFNVYEETVALSSPSEFKARHILVETQAAAITLIAQLQDGADFVELAKSSSTGPSASSGGDLGWFSPQAMVKPFSDAVAGMEDGAFTLTPVQTQFGWHVILREDSRESAPPPLDSVRDSIQQRIAQQKFREFTLGLRDASVE